MSQTEKNMGLICSMKEDMFNGLSIVEFSDRFRCEADCLEYMAKLKWAKGFVCRKCGHTRHGKGYTPFARRCSQCRYDESVTAGTMLEKCKTGLLKAFYGLYHICVEKKGIPLSISPRLGRGKDRGRSAATNWLPKLLLFLSVSLPVAVLERQPVAAAPPPSTGEVWRGG
ncbi:MAG: IS1595 family transposase [Flavobacteriaceae bacterium]|nr:IS1595 family transposase [Flavobacteriaceae bacterium]